MSEKQMKAERAAQLKAANERAELWNKEFTRDMEIAVVQDDGSRLIGYVHAPALAGQAQGETKLTIQAEVRFLEDANACDPEIIPISRIRKRAINIRKSTDPLRVDLTDEERLTAGDEVADAFAKIGTLESNLDSVKASLTGQIKMTKAEIEVKTELIRNGFEVRPVECETVLDFDTGRVVKKRRDNGDIIENRPMRGDERERELALFPELNKAPEPEEPAEAPQEDGQTSLPLGEGKDKAPQDEDPAQAELKAALAILKDTKRASATTISRKMNVGLRRAVQILDALQAAGAVGPANQSGGTREILVDLDTFELA